mgnify:CR=1 FL=1
MFKIPFAVYHSIKENVCFSFYNRYACYQLKLIAAIGQNTK